MKKIILYILSIVSMLIFNPANAQFSFNSFDSASFATSIIANTCSNSNCGALNPGTIKELFGKELCIACFEKQTGMSLKEAIEMAYPGSKFTPKP